MSVVSYLRMIPQCLFCQVRISFIRPHCRMTTWLALTGCIPIAMAPRPCRPAQVEAAPEVLMVVMQIDLEMMQRMASRARDSWFQLSDRSLQTLVNGEVAPSISVAAGEWTRFRVIYAGWLAEALNFNVGCEMVLLAKDGIYIPDFPRSLTGAAPIPAGGRADLMLRCAEANAEYPVTWGGNTIATVTTGEMKSTVDLESWSPSYPSYLEDLRSSEVSPNCSCETRLDRDEINGHLFEEDLVLHQSFLGAVVERSVRARDHPYHQHVYPFQVVSGFETSDQGGRGRGGQTGASDAAANYAMPGDWHDTIAGNGIVRYRPSRFAGKAGWPLGRSQPRAFTWIKEEIASKSPVAVVGTKVSLNYSRDHSVQEGLEHIKQWNSVHLLSEDVMKAAQAIMMKSKPEFSKLYVACDLGGWPKNRSRSSCNFRRHFRRRVEMTSRQQQMLRMVSHGSDMGEGQGTFLSSVINLSAASMGCSILALPRVFAVCGMRWSLVFLVTFSLWVELSLRWLVACGRFSGCCGFKENAQYFLGRRAAKLVHFCQVLLLCGGIVMIFVTASSLLGCSARELLASLCTEDGPPLTERSGTLAKLCRTAHPAPCMSPQRVLTLIVLVVLPLACQKSLHSLTGVSMLSFVCLAYFFIVLLVRLANRALTAPALSMDLMDMSQQELPLFWQGPPVLLMSFLCHTTVLQLDSELRPEAKAKVSRVIRVVIFGEALPVYAVVGAGGLWLKGTTVSANVLQDFTNDPWMAAARLTLGLMNVAKLATAVITLREALVSLAPSSRARKRLRSFEGRLLMGSVALVLGALAAYAIPSLTAVLSLLGCTVGVLFSLCLPAALYAMLLRRVSRTCGHKRDLEEPLLAPPPRETGPVQLPSSDVEWTLQWLLCAAVFTGGLFVGGLGLMSWVRDPC
eukprot:s1734_g7.t1